MQATNSQSTPTSVILGATSALGQAVARKLAAEGHCLVLCARNSTKLEAVAGDITVRAKTAAGLSGGGGGGGESGGASSTPAKVHQHVTDFDNMDEHEALVDAISGADHVWLFYGSLPDQAACEASWDDTALALQTNFLSAASLLTRLANAFEARGHGSLVVVTSVAGDRGRKSNYVYGTAKGALSLFCQGLRNRLAGSGVQVLDVKPGFIDTPMTAEIEKKPAVLWATADQVAGDMVAAHKKGRDIVYTRWFWRYILLIIKCIPERIFKKLSL